MVKKYKELLAASYILKDSKLIFDKYIKDIRFRETDNVVEMILCFEPISKKNVWRLKQECIKEPQYINSFTMEGMICFKFLALTKYKDLISIILHSTANDTHLFDFLFNSETTKNPGRS